MPTLTKQKTENRDLLEFEKFEYQNKKHVMTAEANRKKLREKTVAVVGLGYVGLPLAILAAQKNYTVIGIDSDTKKVEMICKKISPFKDKKIEDELSQVKLPVSAHPIFLREAGIIIVCVPTPVHHDHTPDFTPLIEATRSVAQYLVPETLVIIESTVNPGVCESIVLPLLETGSGLTAGKDFQLSHCPERINPGDTVWNIESINRVVGSFDQKGLQKTLSFYRSIVSKGTVTPMGSLKEAEAVKVVENSFRDINIAFVNELAMSFGILGIDVVNVIKGASTKPFSFMAHFPGCGVGGHCIPVDPYYLIEYGKENGFMHEFLMLARKINNNMPIYAVTMLEQALQSKRMPRGLSKVVIFGATYKPNVDDIRESPSFAIYDELKKRGYEAIIYDPIARETDQVSHDLEKSLAQAQSVIIATAHSEFTTLTPDFFKKHGIYFVIDGRNCLDKKIFENSGVTYRGIGR